MAGQCEVVFRHEIDPATPAALAGDALWVRQILSNFISNAIKFSSGLDRAGRVQLVARLVDEKDAGDDRVWIEIDVRDNGVGMDEATRARLFHPFTQADSSTTRKYGGTGLGLVISRRLAEIMNGTIRVDSIPGEGSTFTVRLPFARADEKQLAMAVEAAGGAQPVVAIASPENRAFRILVAEDSSTNQEVIRYQLDILGYTADIASDGREAFSRWLEGRYDIVVSDIHMPNMDGYQLTAAIRAEEAKAGAGRTVIVALTANALKGEAERCLTAGMDDYLSKPVQLTALGEKLGVWMTRMAVEPVAATSTDVQVAAGEPGNEAASTEAADLPLFDPTVLAKMVGDRPAIQHRLLEKFLINAQERIAALRAAVETGDAETAGQVAHSLKSVARTTGAMRLGELCDRMEAAARTGDPALKSLLPGIEESFERARQAMTTAGRVQ